MKQNLGLLKYCPAIIFALALLLGSSPRAHADIISTIPNYDGTPTFGPFPSQISIGDFAFSIPKGAYVVEATISGTFGNNDVPGTTTVSAPADLFVGDGSIEVANCDDGLTYAEPCDTGLTPTAWSYTFTGSNLAALSTDFADGSLDLSAVQNGPFAVNAGSLTLNIAVSPEPNGLWLSGTGLIGFMCFVLVRRMRISKTA